MKARSLRSTLKADIYRYTGKEKPGIGLILSTLYHRISIVHIMLFRIIQALQTHSLLGRALAIPLKLVLNLLGYLVGIHLDLSSDLGEGFYVGHFGGIFIGPIKTGRCCNVNQGVTLGLGGQNTDKFGVPTLGNYVWIGPGAVVYGKVSIGNNVCIGANTVVSKDIPDNAIVVGNPGRIIGYQEPETYHYLDNVSPEGVLPDIDAEHVTIYSKN